MNIHFYKYQGTGNDFIIVDQFDQTWLTAADHDRIKLLCDRRFGIGADGLILLVQHPDADFEMIYFNADGNPGSLCGNGSRCAVACMHHLGRLEGRCTFMAFDGLHQAVVNSTGSMVDIKLGTIDDVTVGKGYYILDTGSPHYVTFVEDLTDIDIVDTGKKIRYAAPFREMGINVNFVEVGSSSILVNTYERGVEDETLSCGTGVTAAALAYARDQNLEGKIRQMVETKGGDLTVSFDAKNGSFTNIWLSGPVSQVFAGTISI